MLHTIKKSLWRTPSGKRVWRWNWNWKWNYCGKWIKWQKCRSWWNVPNWFEWWQTPLYRRLAKLKWFKRDSKLSQTIEIVHLSSLDSNTNIPDWSVLSLQLLVDHWLVTKHADQAKILWWSESSKKFSLWEWVVASFSASKYVE